VNQFIFSKVTTQAVEVIYVCNGAKHDYTHPVSLPQFFELSSFDTPLFFSYKPKPFNNVQLQCLLTQPCPILIRPIEDDDLPGILEVYRQCQDFLALGPDPQASLEMVKKDIEHSRRLGGIYCCILTPDENMLGVLDYVPANFEGFPEQGFISLLMIAAPYRCRGLGQQILAQIEAKIRKNGQIHTILTAVQVNNPGALRFWQRNGYQIISGPDLQPDATYTYRLQKMIKNDHENPTFPGMDVKIFKVSVGRKD
jgi:ribosomal protein S18 acetylase RimI-like enzyme